ncbi:hypothetical protein [Opitutus sp. ER46]|uniref:hypothetical protein n=1 Tax=Opitutus sp. ER46 TaxID=2161864 RepID=UPI000D2FB148|nr:hypothetical protein [Opitutus sp. ER46]PTX94573.1 hypothetical protein DB354_12630 [Opitutus sp. ER46]
MSNFDSDGGPEFEWEDRGDLAWNEFDWERYLREQDDAIERYLGFYEACKRSAERLDQVAEKMSWNQESWTEDGDDDEDDDDEDDDEFERPQDVYTLHKNPIFIATKAIYLGLNRSWQSLASEPGRVPAAHVIAIQSALHAGEDHAVQAIHALDFGDYAMAVSLFKRALSALNNSFALLGADELATMPAVVEWRDDAMSRLFDLREIWLRVMAECRGELERPMDDES